MAHIVLVTFTVAGGVVVPVTRGDIDACTMMSLNSGEAAQDIHTWMTGMGIDNKMRLRTAVPALMLPALNAHANVHFAMMVTWLMAQVWPHGFIPGAPALGMVGPIAPPVAGGGPPPPPLPPPPPAPVAAAVVIPPVVAAGVAIVAPPVAPAAVAPVAPAPVAHAAPVLPAPVAPAPAAVAAVVQNGWRRHTPCGMTHFSRQAGGRSPQWEGLLHIASLYKSWIASHSGGHKVSCWL